MSYVENMVEEWQERAAIREYDGGQPRDIAEKDALEDLVRFYGGLPKEVVEAIERSFLSGVDPVK
jgi:hypothetical protein